MSIGIPDALSRTGDRQMSGQSVDSRYVPHVSLVRDTEPLGSFDATAGWTVLGNDTTSLATVAKHITGTTALEFDKVNGAANTIFAGIQNTITSINLSRFFPKDEILAAAYVSSVAAVAYAFVRIGTSSINYNEWRLDDTAMTAGAWSVMNAALSSTELTVVGDGWDPSAVTWVAVGVAFDAETDALADIAWDHLHVSTAQLTTT